MFKSEINLENQYPIYQKQNKAGKIRIKAEKNQNKSGKSRMKAGKNRIKQNKAGSRLDVPHANRGNIETLASALLSWV